MRIQDVNSMQDILKQVTQNISGDPRTTTVWETLVAPTAHAHNSKPEDEAASNSDNVPDDSVELSEEAKQLRDEMKKALEDAKAQTAEMNKKLSYMEIARRMSMGDNVATSDQIELLKNDSELFSSAKILSTMVKNPNPKTHAPIFQNELSLEDLVSEKVSKDDMDNRLLELMSASL